jgi:uncharacterized protein YfiM (DUF2279 family)
MGMRANETRSHERGDETMTTAIKSMSLAELREFWVSRGMSGFYWDCRNLTVDQARAVVWYHFEYRPN